MAAARESIPGLDAREKGLSHTEPLRLYVSEQAHSSIEKGAILLGIGTSGIRKIPVDEEFRMVPRDLETAIRKDRDAGSVPFA
jgi:aromatic-L-amino-acid decarboxylase